MSGICEKMLNALYFSSLLVCSGYYNKIPWIRWLKQRFKLEVLEGGGLKAEPAWLGSGEHSLPGLQMAAFLLCAYVAFPWSMSRSGLSLCLLISPPILLN